MTPRRILGPLLPIVAGLLYFSCGGHQTPPGQPVLQQLTAANVDTVKAAFNQAQDEVRVLVLLSPT